MYFYQFYIFLLAWFGTGNRNCFVGMFPGRPVRTQAAPPGAFWGLTTLEERVPWQSQSEQEGGAQGPPELRPSMTGTKVALGALCPVQVLPAPGGAQGGTPGLAARVAPPGAQPVAWLSAGTVRRRQAPTRSGSPEHVPVTPGGERRPWEHSPAPRPVGGLSLRPALPSDSEQALSGSGGGTDFCKILLNKMAWTSPRSCGSSAPWGLLPEVLRPQAVPARSPWPVRLAEPGSQGCPACAGHTCCLGSTDGGWPQMPAPSTPESDPDSDQQMSPVTGRRALAVTLHQTAGVLCEGVIRLFFSAVGLGNLPSFFFFSQKEMEIWKLLFCHAASTTGQRPPWDVPSFPSLW